MQGQLTITNPGVGHIATSSLMARIADWVARVFGCWHMEMSRPFSHHGQAYRTCLNCGAQRKFNLGRWEMQGSYYFHNPTGGHMHSFELAAVRRVSH